MKIDRLLSIIILLLSRSLVTAKEMAERFDVSKRTIYRDILTLENAGFPIIAVYGNEGGYQLMNEFKLQSYTFSEDEKNGLLHALEMQNELFTVNTVAQIVMEKLRILVKNESPLHVNLEHGTLHHPLIEQETKTKIQLVQKIMANKTKLQISYISANGQETSRTIDPIQLQLKNGSWYLSAYCALRQNKRAFKLTRIRQLTELNETIIADNNKLVKKEQRSKQQIICHFKANQLGKLYDFFIEKDITRLANGTIEVTFEEERTKNLVPFLLMFGANVTVQQPEELKQAHLKAIKEMAQLYF